MKVLAIETSCDDTSIAILDRNIVLSEMNFSQIPWHQENNGVIPEKASRLHQEHIFNLIKKAMRDANLQFFELDAIVFTGGPGLIISLQIGLVVAKMLSTLLSIPLYKINHLEGHIFSPFIGMDKKLIPSKALVLLVSGGHTILCLKKFSKIIFLGETRDDSIGEAYDKVGKIFGLKYPGGPKIDKLLQGYVPDKSKLDAPVPKLKDYDFSYSGLKTWTKLNYQNTSKIDVLSAFQVAAVQQLINKIKKAQKEFKINNLFVVGGVSANSYLRMSLKKMEEFNLFLPKQMYTTDNAAMIGYCFYVREKNLKPSSMLEEVNPNWKLTK